jgi:hypothetical protein
LDGNLIKQIILKHYFFSFQDVHVPIYGVITKEDGDASKVSGEICIVTANYTANKRPS